MRHLGPVGGLTAHAMFLVLLAVPAANALPLPVVWSDARAIGAHGESQAVATGPAGAAYVAGDVIVAGTLGVPALTVKGGDIIVRKYSHGVAFSATPRTAGSSETTTMRAPCRPSSAPSR